MLGRDSRSTRIAVVIASAAGAVLLGATPASAQYPQPPAEPQPNPCLGARAAALDCPDLRMAPPADLYVTKGKGKVLLHAKNNILSRGEGPLEVRGRRVSKRRMTVRQVIHNTAGKRKLFETAGSLVFYNIPGQGPYWKYHEAARFELWSLDAARQRDRRVRVGPKLSYCFRDLKRTRPSKRSPKRRVYPGCSQSPRIKGRTLGTSVGWSDIYPADYHENWINVAGLRGCFEFVHVADPGDHLFENNEDNNEGSRRISLPTGKRVRGC